MIQEFTNWGWSNAGYPQLSTRGIHQGLVQEGLGGIDQLMD